MKKIGKTIVILLILAGWIYFLTSPYEGLNSPAEISSYNNGLLTLEPLKTTDSEISGLPSEATVKVDSIGIPHIFAKDEKSLGYALGYMHARDRYFQMEMISHIAMGRLAEIIGDPGLGSDSEWRAFLFEEKAKETYSNLASTNPELHAYLGAYADGINAYVEQEKSSERDPLYLLWDYEPNQWEPSYTFLIQWYLSAQLTYYTDYVDKQELLDKVPEDIRKILYPTKPENQRFIIPESEKVLASSEIKEMPVAGIFRKGKANTYNTTPSNKSLGSNNWAIAPQKSAKNQAILCNDPHLALTAPVIMYEVQLSSPKLQAYGYTIPGSPIVVSGHNSNIAWGITNGGWDVTELYVLKTDSTKPGTYFYEGEWLKTESKKYTLNSKGQPPYEITVEYSKLGKVVKDKDLTYAVYWHPQKGTHATQTFWDIMQASDWNQFKSALKGYDHPSQNFAYADRKGNIGIISAGKMPVKPEGYAGGLLDGTKKMTGEYLPFDSLPMAYNPAQNYIFSANQEPERDGDYYSSQWYDDLYRPRRIDNLLSEKNDFQAKDMTDLQSDVVDLMVADIQGIAKKHLSENKLSDNWKQFMEWDGTLSPEDDMRFMYKALRQSINESRTKIAEKLDVKMAPTLDQFIHFLLTEEEIKLNGEIVKTDKLFGDIAERTDSLIISQSGNTPTGNPFSFEVGHLTSLPGFSIPVNGMGGSENTVNVNYGAFSVIRTVVALDSTGIESWMITAGGQSGRVNSPRYLQQLPDWVSNQPHLTQSPEQPEQVNQVAQTIHFKKN
ncbi:penicillin acylase family protein [Roseivirga sp. BDSF3-8]|uniref:penicillin acylase family protein n=1 Tax=Roseivirga sp. BDSF3-8 TaxID=3241598 RepID=UPI003531E225